MRGPSRVFAPLVLAAALAGLTVGAPRAGAAECPAGSTRAVVNGKETCLQRRQPCSTKYASQYRAYGFRCVRRVDRYRLCRRGDGQPFDNGEWVVKKRAGALAEDPFDARIDGVSIGRTRHLTFASRVPGGTTYPQVFVIAASGYLRLKSGADPTPHLPFGQSLVLGPAVFGTSTSFPGTTLFFNPQLQRVSVDTCELRADGTGRLLIRLIASDRNLAADNAHVNQILDLAWDLVLYEPRTTRARIDVSERYRFTERVTPDPTRTEERQSFRLVQVSSMYIDDARHDVDAFRFRGGMGVFRVPLDPSRFNELMPQPPTVLDPAQPVLDSMHTDDLGQPNGNTPSYRVRMTGSTGPVSPPMTPRAYLTPSDDLNDDNYGLWVHQRPRDVIARGSQGTIAYTVVATEDPLRRP